MHEHAREHQHQQPANRSFIVIASHRGPTGDAARKYHDITDADDLVTKIVRLNSLTKKDKLMKFVRTTPTLSSVRKCLGVSPTNTKYKIVR